MMVDMDGYPTISTEDDGLYLTVFPPKGKGKKVELPVVKSELSKDVYKEKDIDWSAVERAVREATGQQILVVHEQINAKDGQIYIKVDAEKMSAMLTVVPPQGGGKDITVDAVKAALAGNGIVFGIKDNVIDALVKKGLEARTDPTILLESIEDIVAEGKSMVNGEDAKLEMLFQTEAPKEDSVSPEAAIDYKNVKSIQNVKKGEALAKKISLTNGINGMTVTGEEIKATPGNEVKFLFGKGVQPAVGNPELYVAANDGQVVYKNNKLEVLEIYEIQGDVNLSIGNIDFVGTVIVHGSVGEFTVKAGEDIMVDDVADSATLTCGGKITVKGGIVKSKVVAGGDVTAKYIRNSSVETEKSIIVSEAAMHSTLIAGEKILVQGAKGLLVGGTIAAGHEVSAKEMGAKMATPTEISIGETPKMREEMNKAVTELKNIEDQLDKTKKGIIFLKDLSAKSGGSLPPDKRDMLAKLTRTQFKLMTEQKKWEEVKSKIDAKSKEMQTSKRGKVNCLGIVYTGVKIVINKVQRTISDELKYCTFVEKNGEIQVLPFSG
jgi:uncharacterized protein (DUF342 family)